MLNSLLKMRTIKVMTAAALLLGAAAVSATTVQFQTVMGDFEVNLYDKHTPKTVENFLKYVEAESYKNSFIHRSVPGFMIQGGGFTLVEPGKNVAIKQNAPVINEPVLANRRGTIAMAKLGDNPNSATNQWFINLENNASNLDNQNQGFTVFGEVTGNGMAIVDAIAKLETYSARQNATDKEDKAGELPLRDYVKGEEKFTEKHLVMIQNIVVLNPSPDTADGLNPDKTTKKASGGSSSGSSGGGSLGLLGLLALASFGLLRRRIG